MKELDFLFKMNLPKRDALPDDSIYMEELINLIESYLAPLFIYDEVFISPSIVNNYVKLSYVDPPIKKRYYKQSIAQLLSIIVFKPVIQIEEISKGIAIEINTFGIKEVYDSFVDIFNQSKSMIITDPTCLCMNIDIKTLNHHDKVLYYLSISLLTKLYTRITLKNR